MHEVAVLAMHGVVAYTLSIPCEVFGRARVPADEHPYRVRVCGEAPEIRSAAFGVHAPWPLGQISHAQTLIIPGIDDPALPVPQPIIDAIRAAAYNGARIASICTGAFILAAAGLLNGQRATTHWAALRLLSERYPEVVIEPDALFVDTGSIVTSAGASAGLDMCLHLLRKDHGHTVATEAARSIVAPLVREGGHAPLIGQGAAEASTNLASLLAWIDENLAHPIKIEYLAERSAMSLRMLTRRFQEQTGMTPLQWLLTARIRRAQVLLETSDLSLKQIASDVGFGSAGSLQERFSRTVGIAPGAYRHRFKAAVSARGRRHSK